jgi:hypothetical protein
VATVTLRCSEPECRPFSAVAAFVYSCVAAASTGAGHASPVVPTVCAFPENGRASASPRCVRASTRCPKPTGSRPKTPSARPMASARLLECLTVVDEDTAVAWPPKRPGAIQPKPEIEVLSCVMRLHEAPLFHSLGPWAEGVSQGKVCAITSTRSPATCGPRRSSNPQLRKNAQTAGL